MLLCDLTTPQLVTLCQRYQVRELYAFGSVVTGVLNSESDLDFIVQFNDQAGTDGAFDRFMGLKQDLEQLYGRPVDLLTLKPFRNRIFQAEVDQHKKLLYAA